MKMTEQKTTVDAVTAKQQADYDAALNAIAQTYLDNLQQMQKTIKFETHGGASLSRVRPIAHEDRRTLAKVAHHLATGKAKFDPDDDTRIICDDPHVIV